MWRIRRRSDRGFTLIELLVVLAIIGFLTGMLIPMMLEAMQKAKQKRTVAEMRIAGTAMMLWLSDAGSAAAAGQSGTVDMADFTPITEEELIVQLVPGYVDPMPTKDGWKNPYDFYLDVNNPLSSYVMAVRSPGRDKVYQGTVYTSGPMGITNYDEDLVWTDGFFVRWPDKIS